MQRALVALAVRRRALRNEFDHENVHWIYLGEMKCPTDASDTQA